MIKKIIVAILLGFLALTSVLAQETSKDLIIEDLEYLRNEIPKVHKDAFNAISEEEYNAKIDALINDLDNRNIYEVYSRAMEIIASIGDGHTWIDWWKSPQSNHYFPLKFEDFSDGIYLTYTIKDYEDAISKRLVAIEGIEVEKAIEMFLPITPGDNIYDKRRRVLGSFLSRSTIPYGLGISKSLEEITLTFENTSGVKTEYVIKSEKAQRNPFLFTFIPNHTDRVSARDLATPPLFLKNPHENFWLEYLPEDKTVYLRFWTVFNDQRRGMTINDIAADMRDMIDQNNPEKLVVDVRYNGGGNNQLTKNLLHEIIKADQVNKPGHLFLLINDFTFSAAGHFTTYIEQHTNSILVGTPSAFSPNHYGDNGPIKLPNTGWDISASRYFWQNSLPWDYRTFTEPDFYIEPTFQDYAENRDPVLDFVLNYNADEGSLTSKITEAVKAKNKVVASKLYDQIKTNPLYQFQDLQSSINQLGYKLLSSKENHAAIIAFEINVEQYPESANAHDSLADGYLANGQNELALKHSKRVLELNPSANVKRSAEAKIKQLSESD